MPAGVPPEWITMQMLSTMTGVVAVVTVIVQFLKGVLDRHYRMPTRLLVLIVSWFILLGRRYIMHGNVEFDGLFIDFLNGFMVALTAMGAHSFAKSNLKWK